MNKKQESIPNPGKDEQQSLLLSSFLNQKGAQTINSKKVIDNNGFKVYSQGSAKNLFSEAPLADSQEMNNKNDQTLYGKLNAWKKESVLLQNKNSVQYTQTSSKSEPLSASLVATSSKREVKSTYEEKKYMGEPNLKMALDREFPNMVQSQYVVSSSVHNHDQSTKLSEVQDGIAETKKVIEMFDKSQLVLKKDGTLDRRYNVNKTFLNLLRLAGESEESYLSNSNLRSLSSSSSLKMSSSSLSQQKNVSVSLEGAKIQLESFNKANLVYTIKGKLDRRYNRNKEYIRLMELNGYEVKDL